MVTRYFLHLGIAAMAACAAAPAWSQVFVRPGGAGAQDGSSWGNAHASIQAAVNNPNAPAQDVWVAQGTYNESSIAWPSGVAAYGGFTVGNTSMTQRDFANNVTIIDAQGNGRLITIIGGDNRRVDGFTLTNGNAASEPENGGSWGGAIWISDTNDTTVIANCRITNSTAAAHGGGINVQTANPIIQNCHFENNSTNNFGGGLFNHFGQASIVGCTFVSNTAANGGAVANWTPGQNHPISDSTFINNGAAGNGGAIVSGNGALTTVNNSTFSGNNAGNGGAAMAGFWPVVGDPGGRLEFNDCTFSGNIASNLGGALVQFDGGSITARDSLFEGNQSSVHGGAAASWPGDDGWTFERCVFRLNTTVNGGGAIFHHGAGRNGGVSTLNVINCVFDRNEATNWVAGAIATWNLAESHIVNSTFVGNTAAAGGGALFTGDGTNQAQVFLTNSILSGNAPNQLVDNSNATTWVANTIIQGQAWGGAIDVDPQLVNPGAGDLRITAGSPARNAGLSAFPATDILGTPRPQGPNADMGAYEFDDTPPGISLSGPSAAITNTGPITYTVTYTDFSTITLAPGDITLNQSGSADASIGVSGGGANRTVTLSGITGNGTLGITIASNTAQDWAGNQAPGAGPSATFAVDNTPPTVQSITPATTGPTNASTVDFTVTFSEDVINFDANDLQVNHGAGSSGSGLNISPGGPASVYTVTVGPLSGDGDFTLEALTSGSATDEAGNGIAAGAVSAPVTLDNTPPNVVCQNIDYLLSVGGVVVAADVDGGTTDNIGPVTLSLQGGPVSFGCSDIANNPHSVTLVATDAAGNQSTCTAQITVVDDIPPTAVCQDVTVNLSAGGTITAADIDNGSSDNCGNVTLSLVGGPIPVTCANVGTQQVTLLVVDDEGNQDTCTANVTIVDDIPPTAVCQDVTVNLSDGGTVTAADIDNGSSDNCGNVTLSLVGGPIPVTCANVGTQQVTLLVVDDANNQSTCTANVTIVDDIPPTAVCQDVTVNLSDGGTVTAADIDNGSSDNCGNVTLSLVGGPIPVTCANVGTQQVTLLVVDDANNQSTCTANVTIVDDIPPTAVCQNITVDVGPSGVVSITPQDIDNGSSDNCGQVTLSLDIDTFTCLDAGNDVTVTLTATDAAGNQDACTALVTVTDVSGDCVPPTPLTIDQVGDASITRPEGGSAVFEVSAQGTGTLDYQWKFDDGMSKSFTNLLDGGNISGANSPALTIDPVGFADAGDYVCEVSDDLDVQDSGVFTLAVTGALPLRHAALLALGAALLALAGLQLAGRRRP